MRVGEAEAASDPSSHPAKGVGKRVSECSGTSESTAASERQAVLVRADAALEALVPGHAGLQVCCIDPKVHPH